MSVFVPNPDKLPEVGVNLLLVAVVVRDPDQVNNDVPDGELVDESDPEGIEQLDADLDGAVALPVTVNERDVGTVCVAALGEVVCEGVSLGVLE